ncbi:Hsp33 family molecular chaperone HslO [Undibacterium sp. 14-3-2]|uniref:Hsp33 family molecular chaperone HslO n=1 Tax=Undibacterium sp. 14-3-2 TaxID=2800129 RepID=UPI0019070B3D|nr:Hsp33 family molecular chaperone HslO [Undibacterium sp. 14-3-2]MBK1891056.1 Hsp33 family molecular chaperone HslO [Undibacterium sp. 14-3-2]
MTDTLQKFMFEHAGVRGELVEMESAWQQMQSHQTYPPAVQTMLGELMAAAALLSANLKFNGTMIMQIHGDGPVKLMVVECDSELRLRATAKLADDAVIEDHETLKDLVHAHGHGRFVITLDPNDKLPGQQAYQGIVPLDGDSIATVIENYMQRSEQLDTKLWLAANDKVTRGMLLQKLPKTGGSESQVEDEAEAWNHAVMLGDTLKKDEMLNHDIATLMHRLFWEQTLRVFDPLQPSFHCSCTREKVGDMLKMLGIDEVESAIAEFGKLDINCDFCGKHYGFDPVDCAQLFVAKTLAEGILPPGDSKH